MILIRGTALSPGKRRLVLAAFVHRNTRERPAPRAWGMNPAHETDAAWIAAHAFWFRDDGKLAARKYAEPCWLCDS